MTNNIPTQVVSDFTTIQAANVPMDAIGGLFIKNDFSEIQSRRWTQDGKIVRVGGKRFGHWEVIG